MPPGRPESAITVSRWWKCPARNHLAFPHNNACFCRHVYLKSPGLRMCICASLLAQTHRHRTGMTKRTSKQDSSCSRFFFLDTLFYLFKDNCFCPHLGISVYFLISSDFPVISAGCSIPISWIRVGAISARQPPSLSP